MRPLVYLLVEGMRGVFVLVLERDEWYVVHKAHHDQLSQLCTGFKAGVFIGQPKRVLHQIVATRVVNEWTTVPRNRASLSMP